MSQLVARILLAIFVFPLGAIFYLLLFIVIDEGLRPNAVGPFRRETVSFLISGLVSWIGVAIYWWLLWRSSVKWNGTRIGATVAAVIIAALIGSIIAAVCSSMLPGNDGAFGSFVGSVLAILFWLIATIFLWRENSEERGDRMTGAVNAITCPVCGYNLTGLSELRCPECGSKFTLDELLARQSSGAQEIT